MAGNNRIMILGPKSDGTYVVEFRTAGGETLASLRRSVLRTSIAQPGVRLVSQAPKPVSGLWSVMAVV